jgi:hypothetical protein
VTVVVTSSKAVDSAVDETRVVKPVPVISVGVAVSVRVVSITLVEA